MVFIITQVQLGYNKIEILCNCIGEDIPLQSVEFSYKWWMFLNLNQQFQPFLDKIFF